MNIEFGNDTPTIETYNTETIDSLLNQGWDFDAEGLSEEEAMQTSSMIKEEYRIFQKEDGTCTILVAPKSALSSISQNPVNEPTPQTIIDEMHETYTSEFPDIIKTDSTDDSIDISQNNY